MINRRQNQTEMTNLRELEEEIETYEGTSGIYKSKMYYNYVKENFLIPDDPHHNQKFNRNSYSLVMKVETSEPRDVLQLERTCLTFVRFSTALFFTALGIILNFKLDTSGSPDDNSGNNKKKYFNHTAFNSAILIYYLFLPCLCYVSLVLIILLL